ncbi:HIG1 domain-containing protein [Sphingomonas sp. ASV193]|uniref:HIG1 domain-containing protein n=1 Tax=Sphingomonas sp. ASV193 TaxID=3144405 RepID=UPI0032E915CF
MSILLILALVVAMGAVLYALVRGVIAMANGKDVSGEVQQGYMQKRVLYQGIAIVIVVLLLVVAKSNGS